MAPSESANNRTQKGPAPRGEPTEKKFGSVGIASIKEMLPSVRERLLRMHREAGVGHVGGNLSCLDALLTLYGSLLRPNDRFILSKGHSAGALYVTLWALGRLSEDDLATFHGEGTLLAGHPPSAGLEDVPFATGSLGHGLPLAAGMALAARYQQVDRRVFCMTSDGEWQEGSMWEALIFAAHHRLGNLRILVDANGLQAFGSVSDVASMEPLGDCFAGFAVNVVTVDGHDPAAIEASVRELSCDRPAVIILKTVKGKGVARFEGRIESHYLRIGEDESCGPCSAKPIHA